MYNCVILCMVLIVNINYDKEVKMTIESFFKNSSDSQSQEFLKNIETDSFCQIIDEYPTFIKQRIFENVTGRTQVYFEEKIKKAQLNPISSHEKEEFRKYYEELIVKLNEVK